MRRIKYSVSPWPLVELGWVGFLENWVEVIFWVPFLVLGCSLCGKCAGKLTLGPLARYHHEMDRKPRLLIYERKEFLLLVGLAVMVGVFAFTFGVHLGKRVPPKKQVIGEPSVPGVNRLEDASPSRLDLQEEVDAAAGAAEVMADEALRDEVAKTGIQIDPTRQVELPRKTVAQKTGEPVEADQEPAKVSALLAQALQRPAPAGQFTLQIAAFSVTEAAVVEKALRGWADSSLTPWIREVQIPGKGRWYRVYQGGFETRAEAEAAGSELKAAGRLAQFVVTKAVSGSTETH